MIKFSLLLFFTFSLCFIACNGNCPDPEPEENIPKRKTAFKIVKDMFCSNEGVNRKLNKTDTTILRTNKTVTIKDEGVDLVINMNEVETYYGHDIDVDFESTWTSNRTFVVDVEVDYYGRKEDYKVDVIGQIDGKQINETGKLKFKWDKVGVKFLADCEESMFFFRNISMGFDCIYPTMKAEGLSIADQFEKPIFYQPIFDKVVYFWKKTFEFGMHMNQIGDFSTCVKK